MKQLSAPGIVLLTRVIKENFLAAYVIGLKLGWDTSTGVAAT